MSGAATGVPEGARVVLATHNAGKVRELRQILAPLVPGLEADDVVVGAGDVGVAPPVEDGVTFAENALLKARAVREATGAHVQLITRTDLHGQ